MMGEIKKAFDSNELHSLRQAPESLTPSVVPKHNLCLEILAERLCFFFPFVNRLAFSFGCLHLNPSPFIVWFSTRIILDKIIKKLESLVLGNNL